MLSLSQKKKTSLPTYILLKFRSSLYGFLDCVMNSAPLPLHTIILVEHSCLFTFLIMKKNYKPVIYSYSFTSHYKCVKY